MYLQRYFLNPSFFRFWLANFLSQTGTAVTQISLVLYLYQKSDRPMDVAFLLAVQMIPPMLFTPLYGVVIDRFEKKMQLILYQLVPGILVLGLIWVRDAGTVYLLAFLVSVVSAMIYPTSAASLPMIVRPEEIVRANSMIASSESLVHVMGPALGGVVVSLLGYGWAYFLDGMSFFVGAALLATVGMNGASADRRGKEFLKDFREGIRFLMGNPLVRYTGLLLFSAMFFVGILFPLLPDFNEKFLGGNQFSYGLIMMFFGFGGVAGGLLGTPASGRFGKGRILFFTLLIDGLIMALWSRVYWFPASCLVLVVWGVNIFLFVVAYTSLVQEYVEEHYRGRVFSLFLQLQSAAVLGAVFLAGVLSNYFNTSDIVFTSGVLYFFTIFLTMWVPDHKTVFQIR